MSIDVGYKLARPRYIGSRSDIIIFRQLMRVFFAASRLSLAFGLLLASITFVAGGATCSARRTIPEFAPPMVFDRPPTLEELSLQINRSLAINRLESNTISISSPDILAKLSGSLAWERPHNFNLQAYPVSRVLGLAFAAGSNSEEFWLQRQIPSPPTLYYARHDDFENQPGPRRMLPVSPLWLREALGVVELDPALQHNGPTVRPDDGKVEIETFIPSPRGPYRRLLVLDTSTATVRETRLYNYLGKMVAIAHQSEHQYYSGIDWSLPHRVDIILSPDEGQNLAFTVHVEFYLINESPTTDVNAFARPDSSGISTVILAGGRNAGVPAPPVYTQALPNSHQSDLSGYRSVR